MPRVRRRESAIERTVTARATSHGIPVIKLGTSGWPDKMFLIPGGKPVLIEFKRPGTDLAEESRQAQRIQTLQRLGYLAEVHDSVEGAWQFITRSLPQQGRKHAR